MSNQPTGSPWGNPNNPDAAPGSQYGNTPGYPTPNYSAYHPPKEKKSYTKPILIAMAAVMGLFLLGFGGCFYLLSGLSDEPRAAGTSYLEALDRGDYGEAERLSADQTFNDVNAPCAAVAFTDALRSADVRLDSILTDRTINRTSVFDVDEAIRGSELRGTHDVLADSSSERFRISLIRHRGEWMVCNVDLGNVDLS